MRARVFSVVGVLLIGCGHSAYSDSKPAPHATSKARPAAPSPCEQVLGWARSACNGPVKYPEYRTRDKANEVVSERCKSDNPQEEYVFQAFRWIAGDSPKPEEMKRFRDLVQEMRFDLSLDRFPSDVFKQRLQDAEKYFTHPDFLWMTGKLKSLSNGERFDWNAKENKRIFQIPIFDNERERWLHNICALEYLREPHLWYAARNDLIGALIAVDIIRAPTQRSSGIPQLGIDEQTLRPRMSMIPLVGEHFRKKLSDHGFEFTAERVGFRMLANQGVPDLGNWAESVSIHKNSTKKSIVLGVLRPCIETTSRDVTVKATYNSTLAMTLVEIDDIPDHLQNIVLYCDKAGFNLHRNGESWNASGFAPKDAGFNFDWQRFPENHFYSESVLPGFEHDLDQLVPPNEYDQAKLVEQHARYSHKVKRLSPSLAIRAVEHASLPVYHLRTLLEIYPRLLFHPTIRKLVAENLEGVLMVPKMKALFIQTKVLPVEVQEELRRNARAKAPESMHVLAARGEASDLASSHSA